MLKPLSPGLSDLRTVSTGPAQICSSLDPQGFPEALGGSSEVDPGSPEGRFQAQPVTVFQDGVNSNPPSNPSSPSGSSSSSRCGFYSFVEDPASPEAELNQAWMISPQRHAQLATLKMERGFKLQTYANSTKPQSLFSENGGDLRYQVDLSDGEEEDEKLLRKEIIRHQAPRGAPRLMEGSSPPSRPGRLSPAASSSINKDSINFTAARQQFLRLEQERGAALLKPVSFSKPEDNRHRRTNPTKDLQQRMANVLDSTLQGLSSSSWSSVEAAWSSSSKRPATGSNALEIDGCETPIQREIRLTRQREENLRRDRGLKISTAEIVEIRTKRLQSPNKAKDLQQEIQKIQRNEQRQLKADVQEEREGPEDTEKKAEQNERREERPQPGDTTDFPSPCRPHQHPEEAESELRHRFPDTPPLPEGHQRLQPDRLAPPSDVSSPSTLTLDTPRSWREKLQSRKSAAPHFMEKEIEEALKREEELQERRAAGGHPAPRATRSPDSRLQPATRAGTHF